MKMFKVGYVNAESTLRARSMALSKAMVCGAPSASGTSERPIYWLFGGKIGGTAGIYVIDIWDPDEGHLWRIQGQGKIGLGEHMSDGLSYM